MGLTLVEPKTQIYPTWDDFSAQLDPMGKLGWSAAWQVDFTSGKVYVVWSRPAGPKP